MKRRSFLQTSAATLGFTAAAKDALGTLVDGPTKRVGLIGTGWYGKVDLLRLIQVAPVEVVSLCDVDSQLHLGQSCHEARSHAAVGPSRSSGHRRRCSQRVVGSPLPHTLEAS